jgi:2',3'-cyclic-nucleotide 2'-phosphodiesterase (5'-nucleotidase family)
LLACCFLVVAYGESRAEKLRILHTNDVHSHHLPFVTSSGDTLGGTARLATLVERQRAEVRASLLVDAGDMFQGTHFYNFFKGEVELKVMSAIGYDCMAVGNHELDDGVVNMIRQKELHARFPILCSNIWAPNRVIRESLQSAAVTTGGDRTKPSVGHDQRTILEGNRLQSDSCLTPDPVSSPIGIPCHIHHAEALRIGLIGITTETLPTVLTKKGLEHLEIRPVVETLRKLVPEVRSQADLVVVLSHCGLDADSLTAATVPGIDVIVSGHDHRMLPEPRLIPNPANDNGIDGTLLVETGQWGGRMGQLDLEVEGRRIVSYRGQLLPVTPELPESPRVAEIVETYRASLELLVAEVIAESPEPLFDDSLLVAGCPLGNLVADLMRKASGADLALQNGGGIRGSLPAGPIRIGDVYTALPFDNSLVTISLTAAHVERLCREMASMRGRGGFGHVSGLKFRVEDGDVTDIEIGGLPLSSSRNYLLATNNFTAAGGDGYTLFKEAGDVIDTGLSIRDAVIDEMRKDRIVRPSHEKRIRFEE